MTSKKELEGYACHLADQYRAGLLLPEIQSKGWELVWKDLTRELRCRHPGFSALQYGIALNQGFVNLEQHARYRNKNAEQAVSRRCSSSDASEIARRACINDRK
jgi:hypothetical protein